ncbi:peptidoglycan D,D-transpeptidase FtsI family protein [Metabacillus iocasae]|uniref:serine-type D-Ala-D-Ala carboxypeptidase n=1 Tax=Priestia iocasae TaxID=2291674 RepID=A0ABS2QW10_9BACI|nr:penicillin-binding protein 2 [Metabacillus iocasae]MBM7702664.1 cell division protein FtsI/penicillin-binding protein 2 [Metabacillus iocasae]
MKKKKKKKTHIPFRLNFLFFIVFLLFSLLILRLGFVQIVSGESYKEEVEKTEDIVIHTPVPRGHMYDRYHRVIVDNKPLKAITYTRAQNTKQKERIDVATKLASVIDLPVYTPFFDGENKEREKVPDEVRLTERDLKDYWMVKNPKKAQKKVTKNELQKVSDGKLEDKDLYKLQLERISKTELQTVKDEVEIIAIKTKMDSGYALTPQIIKSGVGDDEFARVSENLQYLSGVDVMTYWDRQYTYDGLLRTLLGNVTSANEGLPREKLDYFLSRNYSRNDQVGKSYLEKQYEHVLHGQKARSVIVTNRAGNVLEADQLSEGQRGSDLILTIDMELQKKVEDIVTKGLLRGKASNAPLLDRIFVMLMNPHTGEILTMAGKQYVIDDKTKKSDIRDFALGNMTTAYEMGSTVKGATILAGFDSGSIRPNTYFMDQPLQFAGSPPKKSYVNMGSINDVTALQRSSNVYMFRTVMAMANVSYVYKGPLPIKFSTFEQLRSYYAQFGLGVHTGIDLDSESTGLKGVNPFPGNALDLSIGQYDTYTPLQLIQYVSTIANGGYRVKPQLVKEIREPLLGSDELGSIQHSFEPHVLNRVTMTDSQINRVKEGFRRVMQVPGGTAYKQFSNAPYSPAGKTGTAEAYNKGRSVRNSTLIAYAPHTNPEVSMVVVVPSAYMQGGSSSLSQEIGREVLDTYFGLTKQGEEELLKKESEETN